MTRQAASQTHQQAPAPALTASGVLQRKCDCGQHTIAGGECGNCKLNRNAGLVPATLHFSASPPLRHETNIGSQSPHANGREAKSPRLDHNFSHIPARADFRFKQTTNAIMRSVGINGAAATSRESFGWSLPAEQNMSSLLAQPPGPLAMQPQRNFTIGCPTDIEVLYVTPKMLTESDVKGGWLTGFGAQITMKVSDEEGADWKGTKIHENVTLKKRACGLNCCGNTAGLNKEGDEGSNWLVGEAGKNTFIDTHMAQDPRNMLEVLGEKACEGECEQTYDCEGTRFGPRFSISYSLKPDTIASGGKNHHVTQVSVTKRPLDLFIPQFKTKRDETRIWNPALEKLRHTGVPESK